MDYSHRRKSWGDWWDSATREWARGTNRNTDGCLWMSGGWQSTGTGCPEKLWSFLPWTYLERLCSWAWVSGSRRPCQSRWLHKVTSREPFQSWSFSGAFPVHIIGESSSHDSSQRSCIKALLCTKEVSRIPHLHGPTAPCQALVLTVTGLSPWNLAWG